MKALVFGGGAARGLAHISIWRKFEQSDVQIFTGTSMGALIAAFAADGKTGDEMIQVLEKIEWLRLLSRPTKGALMTGKGIKEFLESCFGNRNIEDLPCKFACIATDINTGEEVILDKGSIVDALRSTISLPGILEPHFYQGRYLVDGGLVNNLPIIQAEKMGATEIYAFNVRKGKAYKTLYSQLQEKKHKSILDYILDYIRPTGPKFFYDFLEKSYEILGDCVDQKQINGVQKANLIYEVVALPNTFAYADMLKWKKIVNYKI